MELKKDISLFLLNFILIQHLLTQVNGASCTWPTEFQSTQWHDSSRGILTFETDIMQGWTFTPTKNTKVSSWDCVSVSTFDTDGRMILITSTPFQLFSITDNYTDNYAYLCITVTKVTESSYRYYINQDIQTNINNERLFINPLATLTDQGSICSDNGASGGEYQMLIKKDSESGAKVNCPWHFLGRYGYTHTSSVGTTTCDQATSDINMCTETQHMTFDYTQCSTKVAYSDSNTVWCVDNVEEGGSNYVMLFNGNDADAVVNNQDIYRFTCMAVSETFASVSPKYCQSAQTPYELPKTAAGLQTGALLTFSSAKETCKTCTNVSDPLNGNVTVSTTGSVTSALYTCAKNYTLWGIPSRMCQADNTWTGAMPSCSCGYPDTPSNGKVEVNSDGSIATYTCNVGYSLNGSYSRNCQTSSATWEGSDPSCTQCEALLTVTGKTYSLSTNGTSSSASFACASGYTLNGSSSINCSAVGEWNDQQPKCDSPEPETGASTDTSKWSVPIAAIIVGILIFLILVVLLGAFIHLYFRLRQKKSSRVSSASAREPEDPKDVEERHPEEMKEPKPTDEKATIVKKYQKSVSRPSSSVTATSVVFANGLLTPPENDKLSPAKQTPKSPSGKVQLPPLSHLVTQKRKIKKIGERTPEKKHVRATARREPRAKTPIKERMKEIGIDRVKTPELLSTADFTYIQPMYTYELDIDTGRDAILSRKGERI